MLQKRLLFGAISLWRFFMIHKRFAFLLLGALLVLAATGCSSELKLDPKAGGALIDFSGKMTLKLTEATAGLSKATNAAMAAAALEALPPLFKALDADARSIQAQYSNQNFADFRTAADKRTLEGARKRFSEAIAALAPLVKDKDGMKQVKDAADALLLKSAQGYDEKVLAAFVAALAPLKNKGDKGLEEAVGKADVGATFLAETALVSTVKEATGKLQAAMQLLNTEYQKLDKQYKEDAVFQAAVKKMQAAMQPAK